MGKYKDVYEYDKCVDLDSASSTSIPIPENVILDSDGGDKMVTAFSFFFITRGIDCKSMFSLNWIVEWSGRKPDRHKNGVNDKFSNAICELRNIGYIDLDCEPSNSRKCIATFDRDMVSDECNTGFFGLVYLDELDKIMSWNCSGTKDAYVNNDILLRVFAYLRMKIRLRRNRLFVNEVNMDGKNDREYDIEQRRIKMPEAYNAYYQDMAEELDISPRVMSRAVDTLCEMGLIYAEALPRVNSDGRWNTTHTIFCNAYKREKGNLLASGIDYYGVEVANKKRLLETIKKRSRRASK